jgi:hypothetical protein
MSIQRIALKGWTPTDFNDMRPGSLLLSPILPDADVKTKGGLYLPGQEIEKIPGTAALCYRVVACSGDVSSGEVWNPLRIGVGDVVVVRNAMLDPIDTTLTLALLDLKHVLLKVKPEALEPEPEDKPEPMSSQMETAPPLTLDQLAERFRARTMAPDLGAICTACEHPADSHTTAGRCVVAGCACGEASGKAVIGEKPVLKVVSVTADTVTVADAHDDEPPEAA